MIKKLMTVVALLVMTSMTSFAQWNFPKAEAERILTPVTDWMSSGTGALTYVSAKAPTAFGFRIGLMAAGSAVPEIENADNPGFAINNAALVASVGTMGFEATLKLLPAGDFNSMTVGAKYELSKLLPLPPGLPLALAAYADYNKSAVKVDNTELSASNVGFGGLVSADLVLIKVYGRLGYEIGSGNMKYTYVHPITSAEETVDISPDSNSIRAAAGASLGFIDVEVGYRSYAYYAAGLSFGF